MDTADDRKAIQSVINQIVFYPLKDFESRPLADETTERVHS